MPRLSRNRLNMEDGRIDRASLKDWSESALGVSNNVYSGPSYTVNVENGTVFNVILNENCVFSFANPTGSGNACSFTLILKQDNYGGRTVTFPTIYWPGGVQPTLARFPGDFDVIEFSTVDGGAKWIGNVVQRNRGGTTFANLFMWGYDSINHTGQIGDNAVINRSSPVQIGTNPEWAIVASGGSTTGAVRANGTFWTWGFGTAGGLASNATTHRSSPVQVGTRTDWSRPALGTNWGMITQTDGSLWVWGSNASGQLGLSIATSISRSSPVQLGTLTNWSRVAAVGSSAAAVKTDGTLWTWGNNTWGQLGANSTTWRSSPAQVGALTDWKDVRGGLRCVIATKTDNTIWAFGQNTSGELGLNTILNTSSPTQIGTATNWGQIAPAVNHTLAIKTDGTLWAWGNNSYGKLSTGDTVFRSSPVQVGTLNDWVAVTASPDSAIAIKNNGTLWAWGFAAEMPFNNGIEVSSPVQVGTDTSWVSLIEGKPGMLGAIKRT